MRCVEIQGGFGLENLALTERPDPQPGFGQVLVQMTAASLNYRDLLMVTGRYDPRQRLPLIPGSDGAGRVLAVGEGVTDLAPGDRVVACFFQDWVSGAPERHRIRSSLGGPLDGTLTERAVFDRRGLVRAPEHLSDVEAATLPCAALTAWSALVTLGGVTAGDTVLLQGTGGVSTFALQIAAALGARVIQTSSSDDKLERARAMGAWRTLNYRDEAGWGRRARALTDGRGVDLVVEVGGAGTLEQSLRAIRPGGTIALIGILAGAAQPLNVLPILMRQIRVQGVLVGHREGFEAMNRALAVRSIHPVVDRVFPLAEIRAAFDHLASGGHYGKIGIDLT